MDGLIETLEMLLELRKAKKSLACDQAIQTRKPLGNCLIFFLISLRVLRILQFRILPQIALKRTHGIISATVYPSLQATVY